jgi:hypothetical protein
MYVILSHDAVAVNDALTRTWKETIAILSQHLPGRYEENHDKTSPEIPSFRAKYRNRSLRKTSTELSRDFPLRYELSALTG